MKACDKMLHDKPVTKRLAVILRQVAECEYPVTKYSIQYQSHLRPGHSTTFLATVAEVELSCTFVTLRVLNGIVQHPQKNLVACNTAPCVWAITLIEVLLPTEPSCRRNGLGKEALLTMMDYGMSKNFFSFNRYC